MKLFQSNEKRKREDKMLERKRIETRPDILGGKPIIKGTRISVEFINELFLDGWDVEKIFNNYPQLTKEGALIAVRYASKKVIDWSIRNKKGTIG